jgi:small subunit ribosomal protein S14
MQLRKKISYFKNVNYKLKYKMAKESVKARQRKREAMVAKYADKRAALKAAGNYAALDLLPKNASPVRLKNRCQLTGRPRGYMRYFGVSRLVFRDMALQGKIPGVRKASW